MIEITTNHIIGAAVGFLVGYLVGVATSKFLKMALGLLVLAAAIAYFYWKFAS